MYPRYVHEVECMPTISRSTFSNWNDDWCAILGLSSAYNLKRPIERQVLYFINLQFFRLLNVILVTIHVCCLAIRLRNSHGKLAIWRAGSNFRILKLCSTSIRCVHLMEIRTHCHWIIFKESEIYSIEFIESIRVLLIYKGSRL